MEDTVMPELFCLFPQPRLHCLAPVPNERSTRGQTACTQLIRAILTVFSRPVVFSDRNERISKLGDRIVLSTQLQ